MQNIREAAAAEAANANKDSVGRVNKGGSKQAKPKPKQTTHRTKRKDKDSSSKKIKFPDDNLDEYFGLSQDRNSQGTANVTPTETPKKSEGAKSKDDPKSSSHGDVHKSPQGSGGEGSPEPILKSKGSPQQMKKQESEDSSSSSSLRSDSQSSDENKVSRKEKMKELHHLHPRRNTGLDLHPT